MYEEDEGTDWKSHGGQMGPKKQPFTSTTEGMHIWTHRHCGSTWPTHNQNRQNPSTEKESRHKSSSILKSYLQLKPTGKGGKINFLQWRVNAYIKHSLGHVSGPGVVGPHRTGSKLLVCLLLLFCLLILVLYLCSFWYICFVFIIFDLCLSLFFLLYF